MARARHGLWIGCLAMLAGCGTPAARNGVHAPDDDLGAPVCQPACVARACGPDGCGGSCGSCAPGLACNENSGVCAAVCAPTCDNRECGSDGCGGTCGSCAPGVCHDGTCQCARDSDLRLVRCEPDLRRRRSVRVRAQLRGKSLRLRRLQRLVRHVRHR